jgi:predicted alpha/beta hydrolase family esterase
MRIICVDGFGGSKSNPKFVKKMRKRAKKLYGTWSVEPYDWDAKRGKLKHAASDYLKSRLRARAVGKCFAEDQLLRPKSENDKLYIIAYSMGCLLVLSALEEVGAIPDHVSGIFFLAPAVPHSYSFDRIKFSDEQCIYSYFSNKDGILSLAFEGIEEEPAAGRQGFSRISKFPIVNLKTNLAHRHYYWMARPLTELIGFWENLDTGCRAKKANFSPSQGGKQLWMDIFSNGERTIQRHLMTGWSRMIECGPQHRRLAISKEIGPLMKVIDLDQESLQRTLKSSILDVLFQ